MKIRRVAPSVLMLWALFVPSNSYAQAIFPENNGRVLAGVAAVDSRATIVTWLNMTGDRERLVANVQSAFELGLRRDGIRVEVSAPNFLFCELKFAQSGGVVAFSYSVQYYSFEAAGVHKLLWTAGGIVTVGRSNLTEDNVAKDCVDTFASEWLRWNPR